MLRRLYTILVRLHPRWFRDRFGEEMILIYDDASNSRDRASLFVDVIVSAFRQHVLRDDADATTPHLQSNPSGEPAFAAIDTSRPSLVILAHGGAATVLAWFGLSFLMTPGNQTARLEFAGAHYLVDSRLYSPRVQVRSSGLALQQVPRAAYPRPELSGINAPSVWSRMLSVLGITPVPEATAIAPKTAGGRMHDSPASNRGSRGPQPHPVLAPPRIGVGLYAVDLLLSSIDRDLDSRLSASEIARAPEVLLGLDTNHDGRLTAEECGRRERRSFLGMSLFSILDRDHNRSLSGLEMARADDVLRRLDANQDGWVSIAEINAGDGRSR